MIPSENYSGKRIDCDSIEVLNFKKSLIPHLKYLIKEGHKIYIPCPNQPKIARLISEKLSELIEFNAGLPDIYINDTVHYAEFHHYYDIVLLMTSCLGKFEEFIQPYATENASILLIGTRPNNSAFMLSSWIIRFSQLLNRFGLKYEFSNLVKIDFGETFAQPLNIILPYRFNDSIGIFEGYGILPVEDLSFYFKLEEDYLISKHGHIIMLKQQLNSIPDYQLNCIQRGRNYYYWIHMLTREDYI
jgi:hypothetical protein